MSTHEDALRFIEERPDVYDRFSAIAYEAIADGMRRWSAWAVVQEMRWGRRGGRGMEFPNGFIATFARVWMQRNPQYPKFFELRPAAADAGPSPQMRLL